MRVGGDGWAIFSQDGSPAAHFEFTVAITADGPKVLTPWHLEPSGRERCASAAAPSRPPPAIRRSCYHPESCPAQVGLGRAGASPRLGSGGRNGSQSRVAGTQPLKGIMKVRPSVKPMCEKCKIIRRHGAVLVICQNKRHKQRQG